MTPKPRRAGDLPTHPTLLHPRTGQPLRALGVRRNGQAIWPVIGGDGTEPPPAPPADPPPADPAAPPAAPPADDKPLGPAGERALAAEREARKALEKQLAELSPLKDLAKALNGGTKPPDGKTELQLLQERLTSHETELGNERSARWRAEVAHEAGLTPQQAARLQGATKDELLADAAALKELFPAAPAAPGTPRPDPSQGPRGPGPDIDSRIAEAQAKGDWRAVIRLQNDKLTNKP
jgi:hypothetical protein